MGFSKCSSAVIISVTILTLQSLGQTLMAVDRCPALSSHKMAELETPTTALKQICPSLFPHIPPYLHFSYRKETPETSFLSDSVKWGSSGEPMDELGVVSGFGIVSPLINKTMWFGMINAGPKKRYPEYSVQNIINAPFQKYNMLPGSEEIADKDKLHFHLQRFIKKFGSEFDFMFETYALPQEYQQFKIAARNDTNQQWVLKPSQGFNSIGVKIYKDWRYISKRMGPGIAQKYFPKENQFTVDGQRVEVRLFVVVTSVSPLRVYLYDKGFAKVFKHTPKWETLDDNWGMDVERRDMHWEGSTLFYHLGKSGANISAIMEIMSDIIIKALIVGDKTIEQAFSSSLFNSYNAFQIWNLDFIFEKAPSFHPRLVEVNRYGSLGVQNYPLNVTIDYFLTDMLNLVGHHLPPTVSEDARKEIIRRSNGRLDVLMTEQLTFDERLYMFKNCTKESESEWRKRKQFEHLGRADYINSILDTLLPSDLRHLMIAEDELSRSKGFRRIFPTDQTFKYLRYVESDIYLYKLQDAWENRYSFNRDAGISLLRKLAERKEHIRN